MTSPDIQEKVSKLEERLTGIEGSLKALAESMRAPIWIPIDSFAPEPYRVTAPFTVVLACRGDEFIASWFDANIHASGETEEQAFTDLKTMVLDTFDRFEQLGDSELGPGPQKQKGILRSHIAKLES